jgi:hypothetical protein
MLPVHHSDRTPADDFKPASVVNDGCSVLVDTEAQQRG